MFPRGQQCSVLAILLASLPAACALGGDLSDETLQAAMLYDEETYVEESSGGTGPGRTPLALPTRGPNDPAPAGDPVPMSMATGEPSPSGPATAPTTPSAPMPLGPTGMGGESSPPVLMPPTTPGAGGTGAEPEPIPSPAMMPTPVDEPEPSAPEPEPMGNPFPFPEPEPEPSPLPTTNPTTPEPEPVPEPEPQPEPGPAGSCLSLAPNTNSGDIGVEEVCFTVDGPINGWQVSNISGTGRTVSVNGTVTMPAAALPMADSYTFEFSAGEPAWVAWSYW